MTQLQQHGVFQVAVACPFAAALARGRHSHRTGDDGIKLRQIIQRNRLCPATHGLPQRRLEKSACRYPGGIQAKEAPGKLRRGNQHDLPQLQRRQPHPALRRIRAHLDEASIAPRRMLEQAARGILRALEVRDSSVGRKRRAGDPFQNQAIPHPAPCVVLPRKFPAQRCLHETSVARAANPRAYYPRERTRIRQPHPPPC